MRVEGFQRAVREPTAVDLEAIATQSPTVEDELRDAFGVDEGVIRHDVLALARDVGGKGLLEGVVAMPPENGDGGHGHDHHDHDHHDHENGQCEYKVGFTFPWMRSANCALKVELLPTPPEVIVGTPEERDLLHVGLR